MGDKQLDILESILAEELETTEFEKITKELLDIGMEEDNIVDFMTMAELMHQFLIQVEDIDSKLDLKQKHDLLDNIQLYLLGLPNKIGPLGFLALNHVLEEEEDDEDEPVRELEPLKKVEQTGSRSFR